MTPIKKIYNEVAKELNISSEVVEKVYKEAMKELTNKVTDIDFNNITEEELNLIPHSINISSIGKLYTRIDLIKKRNVQSSKNYSAIKH